jgi:DNA-binding FadR family transcriptional regulator
MTIQELRDSVAAQRTIITSAVALLKGLHDQLAAAIAANDPAAIQAVADDLKANTDSLASAVTENTPAVPPTP